MEGTDRLRQHMEESVAKLSEQILSNAQQEALSIKEDAKRQAAEIEKKKRAQQLQVDEAAMRQKSAMHNLQLRREKLKAKQELIEGVLNETLKELEALDSERRAGLYRNWLNKVNVSDSMQIEISSADELWFKPLLEKTYPQITIIGASDFSGGFRLFDRRTVQDYTFANLMQQNKLEYQEIVANILFSEEEA